MYIIYLRWRGYCKKRLTAFFIKQKHQKSKIKGFFLFFFYTFISKYQPNFCEQCNCKIRRLFKKAAVPLHFELTHETDRSAFTSGHRVHCPQAVREDLLVSVSCLPVPTWIPCSVEFFCSFPLLILLFPGFLWKWNKLFRNGDGSSDDTSLYHNGR